MSTWGLVDTIITYMKNLLFVLCLVVSTTLFYSCGDDKDNDPQITDEVTIVQNGLKGKFYDVGITAFNFLDSKKVGVWSEVINNGEYYIYENLTFNIYPEKQYIVIGTSPETLLYYSVNNGKITLYTDVNKADVLNPSNQPNHYTNESKEPNSNNEIYLTFETTKVDFSTWEYLPINAYREMYVNDIKTGKTILTFKWVNYKEIKHIGTMGTKNLIGFTSGRGYIDNFKDSEGNIIYDKNVNVYENRKNPDGKTITTILLVDIPTKNIKGYIGVIYNK